MAKHPYDQHLSTWVWTVGGLLGERAEVRFYCPRCELLFDVDLRLIERTRGRGFSLVHHTPRCNVACCRSMGFFLAAPTIHHKPILLMRHNPKDSAWKQHWTFHAFEADMKARIGVDRAGERFTTIARQTTTIPYPSA